MASTDNTFDPVLFSLEENAFLLEHIGEPPVVAMRSAGKGVNPNAVMPALTRVYELTELERHRGEVWCGVGAIKASIATYLEQAAKWAEDKRRGAPRFPSMHTFDGRGKPHWAGVGSDSGQIRTYFTPEGRRVPFAVDLIPSDAPTWKPEWLPTPAAPNASPDEQPINGLAVNTELHRIECLVPACGHTESFNPDSRASFSAARGRMSKHLRTATQRPDDHREIHTNEFGGSR